MHDHPAESRYDLAFTSLPEPILLIGQAGQLDGVNDAAAALIGECGGYLAPTPGVHHISEVLPWLAAAAARVLAGGEKAAAEGPIETPRGRRHIAARLRRLRDAQGRPRGAVAVLEDLTEKRRAEARARAGERLAALGNLAAGLAQEVNSPLACVVSGLSFLEAEHDRIASSVLPSELGEARLALEDARDAALRVSRIVRSLQSFGRATAPLLRSVELSAALREAIRQAEPIVQGRARLAAVGLSARPRVWGREALLVEIFLALLESAARAVQRGQPERNTIRVALVAGEDEARVTVSDTGAFFTADPDAPGPRFGLSMCHGIVAGLGGSLVLEGAAGQGTTATVTLPLDAVPANAAHGRRQPGRTPRAPSPAAPARRARH
jgi:C4-dicarboxylate-specific signal transduction histidine kinase